jgi:hypothetical protein
VELTAIESVFCVAPVGPLRAAGGVVGGEVVAVVIDVAAVDGDVVGVVGVNVSPP